MKIILASKSPRRSELLASTGLNFTIQDSNFDESRISLSILSNNAEAIACELAAGKASSVSILHPNAIVVGADTAVWLDDVMLGKPRDEAEAMEMIRSLVARHHKVVTGVAVARGAQVWTRAKTSIVTFSQWKDCEIESYIRLMHPFDKAGAYGIQELEKDKYSCGSNEIDNVMGLPLDLTLDLIRYALGAKK